MKKEPVEIQRRTFLKSLAAAAVSTVIPASAATSAATYKAGSLQVWSCGGLCEAFEGANERFREKSGIQIDYTGAFAAALGKSLLGGAKTEVFAGRVLKLAQTLREKEKMLFFKPLCFTEYALITPKGNPAGIQGIQDLARPGVRLIMPFGASPPGGDASRAILKKAGIEKEAMGNLIETESCVITMMPDIIKGRGDVSVVEKRLTRMAQFSGQVDVVPIPEQFFPPGPLTFTVGVMKYAKDMELARAYVDFLCSEEGQSFFERQGFIPAISEKGRLMVERLGVKDV
jgi:molybdate transport system substrate-binding protein